RSRRGDRTVAARVGVVVRPGLGEGEGSGRRNGRDLEVAVERGIVYAADGHVFPDRQVVAAGGGDGNRAALAQRAGGRGRRDEGNDLLTVRSQVHHGSVAIAARRHEGPVQPGA